MLTKPLRDALFPLQILMLLPALIVGDEVIVTVKESFTGKQVPILVASRYITTDPFAVSAGLGKYVAFKSVFEGVKIPVPLLVHCPVVVAPITEPDRSTLELFAQTDMSLPASTHGAGVIVRLNELLEFTQAPTVVKVIVTLPFEVSALDGKYVAIKEVSEGVNVPVPLDDHCPNPNPPVIMPLTCAKLFAHIV